MNISHTRQRVVQSCGSYVTQHYAHVELHDIEGPETDKMLQCVTGLVGLWRNSCSLRFLPSFKSRVTSRCKKESVGKEQKSFWFNHETLFLGANVSKIIANEHLHVPMTFHSRHSGPCKSTVQNKSEHSFPCSTYSIMLGFFFSRMWLVKIQGIDISIGN